MSANGQGGNDPLIDEKKAEEWLESLPTLDEGQIFCFECTPDVPCFNRCCRQLTLPLTPYDVMRLRRGLGMESAAFLDTFCRILSFPDSGLPIVMLSMLKDPDETCPFVTPVGCHVYDHRPSACRSYPLGRGTRMARDGMAETIYLVNEPHCRGFDDGRDWTSAEWFEHEGLGPYNASNDRYARLGALITASGDPISEKMGNMAMLSLYQLDKFHEFVTTMKIFDRVEVDEERRRAILESEEALLDFGFDWMELVLFGRCDNLARK